MADISTEDTAKADDNNREKAVKNGQEAGVDKENIREAFAQNRAYNCLECGKCSGICPVALLDTGFSPRLVVKRALLEYDDDLCGDENLWECLTCGLCLARCHSDVNLPEFIRQLRKESTKIGNEFLCTHNNVFKLIPQLQLRTGDSQDRLYWLTDDIKYKTEGDTLFFVGCAPYHEIIFKEKGQDNLALPLASLKLLNAAGIEPVLLQSECCCGHDAYWSGEDDIFEKLVKKNLEAFKKAGIKQVITACPEGHYMFSKIYPQYAEDHKIEAKHITEIIAGKIDSGELELPGSNIEENPEIVSYQDSCRLGRYSDIYEAPRKLIGAMGGVEFRELLRNRSSSGCCGVSGFINCDMNSRLWRQQKLAEAEEVGATTLLTGCPKCAIHLNCYLDSEHMEKKFDIKVKPVVVELAEKMGLMQDPRDDN